MQGSDPRLVSMALYWAMRETGPLIWTQPLFWPGSYGDLIVKGVHLHWVSVGSSKGHGRGLPGFGATAMKRRASSVTILGGSPMLRPAGLQARIRWNLLAPYHGAPSAGPLGSLGGRDQS